MRVTIVSRIFSPEPAAASFALRTLAERLRARGADVTVVTSRPPAGLTIEDPDGVTVSRARVLRDREGYVRGYLQYLSFDIPLFFRLLFSRRADVIFVEPPPTTGAVVRVVSWIRRVPYVYDAADIWSDAVRLSGRPGLVARVLRVVELFALRGADRIVTISDGVEARLQELGIRTPIVVTGFGADTREFPYRPRTGDAEEPCFVYPGSYSAWHGSEVLVEGFARFARSYPHHRLTFIGNGTERPALEALASSRGIADRVSFRAPMEPAGLAAVLSGAVAAVASLRPGSGYEYAFTTKVYSALATGCPVIFSGPGPTASFVAAGLEAGLPVGEAVDADADQVADAMMRAAEVHLTEEQRSAIADWTAREHSLTAVADRIADVIDSTTEPG